MNYTKIETEKQYNEYCDIIINILETDKEELRDDELKVLSELTNAWCDEKYPRKKLSVGEWITLLMRNKQHTTEYISSKIGITVDELTLVVENKKELTDEQADILADFYKMQKRIFKVGG